MATSNKEHRNDNADEIDLLELARVLLHKFWVLAIALVIGGIIAAAYTAFLVTPLYTAESTIYVYSKSTSLTSLTDLQISNQLTGDFQYIATTRETLNEVISELGLNIDEEKLEKMVSVTNPDDSHMLKITVTNADPTLACNISNTLADVLREQIAEIMNTDKPSMVEKAIVPTEASSPSLTKNTAVGGMVGLVIAAGIIIALHLSDDTITTEEDVRKYLNLKVLASIPYSETIAKED